MYPSGVAVLLSAALRHGRLRARLGGGDGLIPAAARLVGAAGSGDRRARLLHALVVLDLLLPALVAAECRLTPARSRQQNPTNQGTAMFLYLHSI